MKNSWSEQFNPSLSVQESQLGRRPKALMDAIEAQ